MTEPPLHDERAERMLLGYALDTGVMLAPADALYLPTPNAVEKRLVAMHLELEKRPARNVGHRLARTCLFLSVATGIEPEEFVPLVEELHRDWLGAPMRFTPKLIQRRVAFCARSRRACDELLGMVGKIRLGELSPERLRIELSALAVTL